MAKQSEVIFTEYYIIFIYIYIYIFTEYNFRGEEGLLALGPLRTDLIGLIFQQCIIFSFLSSQAWGLKVGLRDPLSQLSIHLLSLSAGSCWPIGHRITVASCTKQHLLPLCCAGFFVNRSSGWELAQFWSREMPLICTLPKKSAPAWVAQPDKVQSQFDLHGNLWDNHCTGSHTFILKIQKVELTVKKIWFYSLFHLVEWFAWPLHVGGYLCTET